MALKGLAGKVAVVTGAAGGIGEGVARRLVEEGASVVVVDVQAEKAQAVADSLGDSAIAVDADVSLEAGVERYTSEALERFGGSSLYHLNAAVSGSGRTVRRGDDRGVGPDDRRQSHQRLPRPAAALRQYAAQGGAARS